MNKRKPKCRKTREENNSRRIEAVESLSVICVAVVIAKVVLLILNWNEIAVSQRWNTKHPIHIQLGAFGLGGLNEWRRIDLLDTKVHKLDGSPHSDVILLIGRQGRRNVCPARKILRKRKFGTLSLPLNCLGKWPGQNGISNPHWVKICDDHNGQINLRAKQKYEVLPATVFFCVVYMLCTKTSRPTLPLFWKLRLIYQL